MDSQFLKFWGNFLLQTAEGTRQKEEWVRWMNAGNPASGDLSEMLRNFYGLKQRSGQGPPTLEDWDKATARFQAAWADFLRLFDVVPRDRYETLHEEKEALAKTVREQGQTIQALRLELSESRIAEGKMADGFRQLMELQNDQFREVSESIRKLFSTSSAPDKPTRA